MLQMSPIDLKPRKISLSIVVFVEFLLYKTTKEKGGECSLASCFSKGFLLLLIFLIYNAILSSSFDVRNQKINPFDPKKWRLIVDDVYI